MNFSVMKSDQLTKNSMIYWLGMTPKKVKGHMYTTSFSLTCSSLREAPLLMRIPGPPENVYTIP